MNAQAEPAKRFDSKLPRRAHDFFACIFLIGVIAFVYWPELSFGKAFFYFDISSRCLPAREWGFGWIRQGFFPQWCTLWGTGFPFVAESETGICYPINYLFYPWLVGWKAYCLVLLGHLALGGIGSFFLFRRYSSVMGSLLGAMMFALGGRLLTHQNHTTILEVLAWFPFVLFWLDRFAESGRWRDLLWAALGVGMQLLVGSLHASICCLVGYFVFLCAHCWLAPRNMVRLLAGGLVMVLLGVGLGAVQVLPAAELLQYSVRSGGVDREWANWGAVTPELWVIGFVPYLFGKMGYGNAWLNGLLPWGEMSLYHGVLTLPLVAVGFFALRSKAAWLMATLVVSGLVLAAGELHVLGRFITLLPILDSLRIPPRFLILTGLGLCGLATLGFDELLRDRRRWVRLTVLLTTTLLLLLWSGWDGYSLYIQKNLFEVVPKDSIPRWGSLRDLFKDEVPWSVGLLVVGLLACIMIRKYPRTMSPVLLTVFAIDLAHTARSEYPTIDPSFHDPPGSVRFLREHADPPRVFLSSEPHMESYPNFNYSMEAYEDLGECLYGERGLSFGIGTAPAVLPLRLARWEEFWDRLNRSPWFYQLLGIELVMALSMLDEPMVEQEPSYMGKKCFVHAVRESAPNAYYCPRAEWVPVGGALAVLANDYRDPRHQVVLEGPQPKNVSEKNEAEFEPAKTEWLGPNRIGLTVNAPGAGYLVLNETWYPGWSATIEGLSAPIQRANHLFMAIAIDEPGPIEILLTFSSWSIHLGLAVTVLALLVGIELFRRNGCWMIKPLGKIRAGRSIAILLLVTALSFLV